MPLETDSLRARYDPVPADADAALAPMLATLKLRRDPAPATAAAPTPLRVLADPAPGITVVATAETWVEVTAASGTKLVAKVMQPGETYSVPQTEEAPTIFSGNAGGVFFAVNGQTYGPYGQSGQFGRGLTLEASDISRRMAQVDLSAQPELARIVAELRVQGGPAAD